MSFQKRFLDQFSLRDNEVNAIEDSAGNIFESIGYKGIRMPSLTLPEKQEKIAYLVRNVPLLRHILIGKNTCQKIMAEMSYANASKALYPSARRQNTLARIELHEDKISAYRKLGEARSIIKRFVDGVSNMITGRISIDESGEEVIELTEEQGRNGESIYK